MAAVMCAYLLQRAGLVWERVGRTSLSARAAGRGGPAGWVIKSILKWDPKPSIITYLRHVNVYNHPTSTKYAI